MQETLPDVVRLEAAQLGLLKLLISNDSPKSAEVAPCWFLLFGWFYINVFGIFCPQRITFRQYFLSATKKQKLLNSRRGENVLSSFKGAQAESSSKSGSRFSGSSNCQKVKHLGSHDLGYGLLKSPNGLEMSLLWCLKVN